MTVQCIRDGQFVVVVARDVTLPSLSLDTVRLLGGNDPPCAPVGSTPSFAIYQFPVTACGTSMMVGTGAVWTCFAWKRVYANHVAVCRRTMDMWCMRTE